MPGRPYADADRRLTQAAIAHWTKAQGDRLEAATTAHLGYLSAGLTSTAEPAREGQDA